MFSHNPSDLNGKRIIITGGTSGMGKALVETFPGFGAKVVFFGRNETVGNALAESTGAHFMAVEVTDQASVTQGINQAVELLGGVDVLVHAAGISPGGKAEEFSLDDWNEVMDVNSTSTFLTNSAIFPHLKEQGGAILNFTSAAGIQGYPGKASYAASKGAVTAWIRSIAREWAPYNIRVNGIAPAIWTPMYDKTRASMTAEQLASHDETMKTAIPLGGKLGDVLEDYVPILRFLCSDDAKFMTGQMFPIDGGAVMMR